jgi:hypothetical protein
MRGWLAVLALVLAACGRSAEVPVPQPAPVLVGDAVRVVAVGSTLVASNAATDAPAKVNLAGDDHLARRSLETTLAPQRGYRVLQATPFEVGSTQPFWVLDAADPKAVPQRQVTATLLERGERCYVWADPAGAATAEEQALLARRAREIAAAFDQTIHPTDTRLFGSEPTPGVDGDPRVHILISPLVGGDGTTLGYFSRRDEIAGNERGNAKELINVNSRVVLTGSPEDYLGTIAHEFAHMIVFNQKVLLGGQRAGEDLWLDEGLAMYALEANGHGLRAGGRVLVGHVRDFQRQPAAYSLNDWEHNPFGIGYGPVYLFAVYLADRFGEGFLRELTTAKATGFANLEARLQAHGSHFRAVFHDWAAANVSGGYRMLDMHGRYGNTTLPGFAIEPVGMGSLDLRPCGLAYRAL